LRSRRSSARRRSFGLGALGLGGRTRGTRRLS
jgi:hypothetical protein